MSEPERPNSITATMRMHVDLLARLDARAAARGITRNGLIVELLEGGLADPEAVPGDVLAALRAWKARS